MTKPFDEDLELFKRQVCQILDTVLFQQKHRSHLFTWRPPTDIYETTTAVIVKIEIAGMNSNDFKISFVDRVLIVEGIRQDTEAKLNYHCLEIPYGEFQVRVLIPGSYNENNIKAKYENGYLYITLPKSKKQLQIPICSTADNKPQNETESSKIIK